MKTSKMVMTMLLLAHVSRAYSISRYPLSVRGLSSTFSNGHISHIASTGGGTNSCVVVSWVRSDRNSQNYNAFLKLSRP